MAVPVFSLRSKHGLGIGDAAIEQCIQTLEKLKTSVENAPQVRIEHAQLINLDLATRAKKLGLTLSMQPNFSSDSVDYKDRLPHELCELNNPFRMLIDEAGFVCGEDLVFGSDGMPHGLEYALKQSLFPSIANQKLTIDEFKAGYCVADSSRGYINVRLGKDDFEFEVCVV